jgi:hypothetical protein
MINLTEAIRGEENETKKVRLLTSRALINEILDTDSNKRIKCCNVVTPFLNKLDNLGPEVFASEPDVIGWLNLFVELSRRNTANFCRTCADKLNGENHVLPLLSLFLARNLFEEFERAILDSKGEPVDLLSIGKMRMEHWEKLFTKPVDDGNRCLNQTDLGQIIIMHLAEAVLELYQRNETVKGRGTLNLLLVPLLRSIFQNPDRAHLTYFCYHGTCHNTNLFGMLYRDEIGVIEEFRSRSVKKRGAILKLVRDAAQDTSDGHAELPTNLKNEINRIIHGLEEINMVLSPRPKMTRLSQLTCLIRELDKGDSAKFRKYGTHLEGVIYRRANLIEGKSPGAFTWSPLEKPKKNTFVAAVRNRYEQGHPVDHLADLFTPESGKNTVSAWVQDGEVSLLWLCAAVIKAGSRFTEWATGSLSSPVPAISADEIGGDGFAGNASLEIEPSCREFLKRRLCLFDAFGRPTAKCWALLNFLQRATISERPARYQKPPWKELLTVIYKKLLEDNLTEDALVAAASLVKQGLLKYTSIRALEEQTRLPTFLLECLLRDTRPEPYSLFFYPINFEEIKKGQVVPAVFLGGTFAGLEWDCFPSVTERQDYHLTALLDAIRPIIDHEIGRVLSDDQNRFAEGKLAKEREKNLRAIQPAVVDLTNIFRSAQALVFRIESAVDPAWSGLFTTQMHQLCERLFSSRKELKIANAVKGEPNKVHLAHEITTSREQLHAVLTYLARGVDEFEKGRKGGKTVVATLSDWTKALSCKKEDISGQEVDALFHDLPFMRALCEAAVEISSDGPKAATHMALLKLLAVDCIDATRSLHVVQIAAALGLARAGSASRGLLAGFGESGTVTIGKEITGNFWPLEKDGIQKLAELIEHDPLFAGEVITGQFSTGNLGAVADLAEGMEPHRFLRAFRILSEEVLAADRADAKRVTIQKWAITFLPEAIANSGPRIEVVIDCSGRFDSATKLGIWNYVQSQDETYHNLRSNLKLIAQGVGGFPSFLASDSAIPATTRQDVPTVSEAPVPAVSTDDEHRFLVIEHGNENRCTIKLRIGMPKKAMAASASPS